MLPLRSTESCLQPLYALTGCTAVGKTELSLRWAERFDAEIVSCDSLLFYRGMKIGTARPSDAELARAPHHLIDLCEPSQQMDIGRYVDLAVACIREIQSRGKRVLVTGGSGFYLKAFYAPVVDRVEVRPETRQRAARLMEQGLATALSVLKQLNPNGLGGLDVANPRRVVKALERCLETGQSLQELQSDFAALSNPLVEAEKRTVVLSRDKEELNARIEQRIGLMLEQGLVEEVKRLRAAGFESNPSAAGSIGYREVLGYLDGRCSYAEMVEQLTVNTRRLAKKQRTWFRGQLPGPVKHVDLTGGVLPEVEGLFALGDA